LKQNIRVDAQISPVRKYCVKLSMFVVPGPLRLAFVGVPDRPLSGVNPTLAAWSTGLF
jgi:hypothetical protein